MRTAPLHDLHPLKTQVFRKVNQMANTIDDIVSEITDETTVVDGVVAFITGLKQQLADALAGNPALQAKVDAIMAAALSNKAKLATAITANTPAAP